MASIFAFDARIDWLDAALSKPLAWRASTYQINDLGQLHTCLD
jgi:hypothetical protein